MLDNRRPVDHSKHEQMVSQIADAHVGRTTMNHGAVDELRTNAKISGYAHDQLRTFAAENIEREEQKVIPMLDKLVCEQAGRHDPLVVGLCLRRLCLVYRRIAAQYRRLGQGKTTTAFTSFFDCIPRH
jgi:hypothetical protein